MKQKLGISIYPEILGKKETIKYITLAHKNGFKKIFANLLEVQNNKEGKKRLEILRSVFTYGQKLGFDVIVDVNPEVYKTFQLEKTEIDFFKFLGATGIRLDQDFKGEVESILSNNDSNFMIELNASMTTKTIDLTIKKGGNKSNLTVCHNFYPARYTGLKYERFIELSSYFKAKGIKVAAFVTLPQKQKGVGPWNVNEGMPTIEEHRNLSLEQQVKHFLELGIVDDIIISQQGATNEQLHSLQRILNDYEEIVNKEFIELPIMVEPTITSIEKDILFNNKGKMHNNRLDYNGYFIRSSSPRVYYKDEVIEENNTGKILKPGDVVILNQNIGRYKGELHIIMKQIDDSKQKARNLVGKISKANITQINYMHRNIYFKLIKNS